MLKPKRAGYKLKFRKETLDGGLTSFQQMKEDDRNNVKPLYRRRDRHCEERQLSKAKKKFN